MSEFITSNPYSRSKVTVKLSITLILVTDSFNNSPLVTDTTNSNTLLKTQLRIYKMYANNATIKRTTT